MGIDSVRVELGKRSYNILIGRGILSLLGERLRALLPGRNVVVISDPLVFSLYGENVAENLRAAGFNTSYHLVPDGEEHKNLNSARGAYEAMVSMGLERGSVVVSLGGGVIGDLAGFVAATYMRGISFVQVPTTLLAQVDASVGGKVGVNLSSGKNLVGAFHQPLLVLIDTAVLRTLDRRELIAGFAEVIKHGIIKDSSLFEYLEENYSKILAMDEECLSHVIKRCCQIKAEVVSRDEREEGLRSILNYGHTIGHALEAVTGYGKYRHGEAIAIGMVCAARISHLMGFCSEEESLRQARLIEASGLPVTAGGVGPEEVMEFLTRDKKVISGKVRFVLARHIGDVFISADVPESAVLEVLEEVTVED